MKEVLRIWRKLTWIDVYLFIQYQYFVIGRLVSIGTGVSKSTSWLKVEFVLTLMCKAYKPRDEGLTRYRGQQSSAYVCHFLMGLIVGLGMRKKSRDLFSPFFPCLFWIKKVINKIWINNHTHDSTVQYTFIIP